MSALCVYTVVVCTQCLSSISNLPIVSLATTITSIGQLLKQYHCKQALVNNIHHALLYCVN